jgi:uncharacterized protein YnzC (UPF0291/DUF896 family)
LDKQSIERINFLARKSKTEGLSPEEKAEQAALRAAYITLHREALKAQLDSIRVLQEDGTYEKLPKKN